MTSLVFDIMSVHGDVMTVSVDVTAMLLLSGIMAVHNDVMTTYVDVTTIRCRLHKKIKATSDVEYPAYGVTGPTKERDGSPGDRKLAQSAQMYHYQHQKQQMIASER